MSANEDERARQERAFYLHEAGHVIAAIHYGKLILEVFCDGKTGHVEATESQRLLREREAARDAHSNAKTTLAQQLLLGKSWDAYEGEFVNRLAGFAGENLELGRVIVSLARGADDMTLLYLQLLPWLGAFPANERHELATTAVSTLLEKAHAIIASRKHQVFAIADALETKHTLSKSDIESIIAASEQTSSPN